MVWRVKGTVDVAKICTSVVLGLSDGGELGVGGGGGFAIGGRIGLPLATSTPGWQEASGKRRMSSGGRAKPESTG